MSSIEVSEYNSLFQECAEQDLLETLKSKAKDTKKKRANDSTSKNLLYDSCDEGRGSEEELKEKSRRKDLDASSTNIILVKDITDTSGFSVDESGPFGQQPKKRRSNCSDLDFKPKMKIFKGIEGNDDSFESVYQTKAILKRREPERKRSHSPESWRSQSKARLDGVQSRRPKSSELAADPSKYSQSIFKVFMTQTERLVKRKMNQALLQEKQESGGGQEDGKRGSKPTSYRTRNSLAKKLKRRTPNPLPKPQSPPPPRRQRSSEISDEIQSELPSEPEQRLVEAGEDEMAEIDLEQEDLKKSETSMKQTGSKRSVHWEEEVTLIARSNSSDLSDNPWSCGCAPIADDSYTHNSKEIQALPLTRDPQEESLYLNNRFPIPVVQFSVNGNESRLNAISVHQAMFDSSIPENLFDGASSNDGTDSKKSPSSESEIDSLDELLVGHNTNSSSTLDRTLSREFKKSKIHLKNTSSLGSLSPLDLLPITRGRSSNINSHLNRRRSSPSVFPGNKKTHGILKKVDSFSGPNSPRTVSGPDILREDDMKSDSTSWKTLEPKNSFQSGEKQFQHENVCPYEEVLEACREDSDSIDRPFSPSVTVVKSPSKKSCTSQERPSSALLMECLTFLRNVRSKSLDKESLGIICEIQKELNGLADQISETKVSEPQAATTSQNQKCPSRKTINRLSLAVKNTLTPKTPPNYSADSSLQAPKISRPSAAGTENKVKKTIKMKTCVREPMNRDQFGCSANERDTRSSSRSSKVLEAWANTEEAIRTRSKSLLLNIRRQYRDEDTEEEQKKSKEVFKTKTVEEKSCKGKAPIANGLPNEKGAARESCPDVELSKRRDFESQDSSVTQIGSSQAESEKAVDTEPKPSCSRLQNEATKSGSQDSSPCGEAQSYLSFSSGDSSDNGNVRHAPERVKSAQLPPRPPSRKPFFERDCPNLSRSEETPQSTHDSPGPKLDNKKPPPPRMYATLNRNNRPFITKSELTKKLAEFDIDDVKRLSNKNTMVSNKNILQEVKSHVINPQMSLPERSSPEGKRKVPRKMGFSPAEAKSWEESVRKLNVPGRRVLGRNPLSAPAGSNSLIASIHKKETQSYQSVTKAPTPIKNFIKPLSPNLSFRTSVPSKKLSSVPSQMSKKLDNLILTKERLNVRLKNYVPPWGAVNMKEKSEAKTSNFPKKIWKSHSNARGLESFEPRKWVLPPPKNSGAQSLVKPLSQRQDRSEHLRTNSTDSTLQSMDVSTNTKPITSECFLEVEEELTKHDIEMTKILEDLKKLIEIEMTTKKTEADCVRNVGVRANSSSSNLHPSASSQTVSTQASDSHSPAEISVSIKTTYSQQNL